MTTSLFRSFLALVFLSASFSLFGQNCQKGSATLLDWAHQNANTPGQMVYGAYVSGGGVYDETGTFVTTCGDPLTVTMNFSRDNGTSNGIAGMDYRIQQNSTSSSTFTLSFSVPVMVKNLRVLDIDSAPGYQDNLIFSANNNGVNVPVTLTGNSFVQVSSQTVSASGNSPTDVGEVTAKTLTPVTEIKFVYNSLQGSGQQFVLVEKNFQLCCPIPLPVELSNFSSKKNDTRVDLSWVTASERNNDYFLVQRSLDGGEWHNIIKVEGVGNSVSELYYSAQDTNPFEGIAYYRLAQYDFNGEYSYSDILSVNFNKQATVNLLPNPTNGNNVNLELNGFKNKSVSISVVDMTGQTNWVESIKVSSNSYRVKVFESMNLLPGVYFVKVNSGDKSFTKRLIVK